MRWSSWAIEPGWAIAFPGRKEIRMKLAILDLFVARNSFAHLREVKVLVGLCLAWMALGAAAGAQAITTTTVQGTVYLANGLAGSGTLVLSWPAFTTAAGQQVTSDSLNVTIPTGGAISVNLAPNIGATPAGLYYTAVYYLSDGTTTTQY